MSCAKKPEWVTALALSKDCKTHCARVNRHDYCTFEKAYTDAQSRATYLASMRDKELEDSGFTFTDQWRV